MLLLLHGYSTTSLPLQLPSACETVAAPLTSPVIEYLATLPTAAPIATKATATAVSA